MDSEQRVVSGMRPTGRMHLGHYHGVLKNWLRMQHEYECWFFVADWHALTTHYDRTDAISDHIHDTVVDWLAAGINPNLARIFVQSRVPEHAELYLLLAMITPLSWLERIPSFKDAQEKPDYRKYATHGFLGYPLLQSADILIYRAGKVPVGADQLAHVEFTRKVAGRFNHLFGVEEGFAKHARQAIAKMNQQAAATYRKCRDKHLERGDKSALWKGRALLAAQQNLATEDRERLYGYLEGECRIILPPPEALLTETPTIPGLNGEKMSKSLGNTIDIRATDAAIDRKVSTMQTDPARQRRTDPGDPEKCPVWPLHRVYSNEDRRSWVQQGCRSASIGCLDCKKPLIAAIQAELAPIRERAAEYDAKPGIVDDIITDGSERARKQAGETLEEVRAAVHLSQR